MNKLTEQEKDIVSAVLVSIEETIKDKCIVAYGRDELIPTKWFNERDLIEIIEDLAEYYGLYN